MLGYTKKACTELPCKWNADFVKKVQPAPIKDIKFYKESCINKAKRQKIKPGYATASEEEKPTLLQSLYSCTTKPVVLSTFENYSNKFHWQKTTEADPKVPPSLRTLYKPNYKELSDDNLLNKCAEIIDSLKISPGSICIQYIYDVTKTQSTSLTWHEQRTGKITYSLLQCASYRH